MMAPIKNNKPQLVFFFVASSILTHVIGQIQPIAAAGGSPGSSSEATSSTQPLWSYQVKPNSYTNLPISQPGHYSPVPSIFDAFSGLSQRQGALSSSPFLSILPIILIAAGGMLLLLPLLTMMIASPFSGGPFGGYNGGFNYPQLGALNKKRSLVDQFSQRGLIDLIEHVSSSIDEMSRKYSPNNSATSGQQQQVPSKRAKSMNSPPSTAANDSPQAQPTAPANHKFSTNEDMNAGIGNTLSGSLAGGSSS